MGDIKLLGIYVTSERWGSFSGYIGETERTGEGTGKPEQLEGLQESGGGFCRILPCETAWLCPLHLKRGLATLTGFGDSPAC